MEFYRHCKGLFHAPFGEEKIHNIIITLKEQKLGGGFVLCVAAR
jgi:hypothetical protein